jgi:hypothetical protein
MNENCPREVPTRMTKMNFSEFMRQLIRALQLSGLGIALLSQTAFAVEKLHWGPEVAVSLPQPLQIGARAFCEGDEFFCKENLHAFMNAGYFYLPISSKSISAMSAELGARYFPFGKIFYLSGGVGYRAITLSADTSLFEIDDETIATDSQLNLRTLYFASALGASFSLSETLSISFDVGLQSPIMGSGNIHLSNDNTGEHSNNSDLLRVDSDPAVSRIARLPLPRITLFRLTWTL